MSDSAQAVPEGTRTLTKFTAEHAHEVGLPSPEAVNYMMSIATMLASSALITDDMSVSETEVNRITGQMRAAGFEPVSIQEHIQKTIEKRVKANAMAKMLVGREMHMEAMESLQDIDIVKGKIFVRYPQLIAQMVRKGFAYKWVERSNTRAAMEVTRPGEEPELYEFTLEDAKRAGLLSGKGEYNQYVLRPRVMLTARVASEAYRATGGRSNVYTPEEKAEIVSHHSTTDEPTPADVARADVMGKYAVAAKEPPPANVVEIRPEPAASTPAPTPQAAPAPAEPPMPTAVGGVGPLPDLEMRAAGNYGFTGVAAPAPPPVSTPAPPPPQSNIGPEPPMPTASTPAPAPPAKPESAPRTAETRTAEPALKEHLKTVVAAIVASPPAVTKKLAQADARTVLQAYLCGFFGTSSTKELPTEYARYGAALPGIEYIIATDPQQLFDKPKTCGTLMLQWESGFEKLWAAYKWEPGLSGLARRVARQWGHSPEDFRTTVEINELEFCAPETAYAFFRLASKSRDAGRLYKICRAQNLNLILHVAEIEKQIGCTLEDATPKAVEGAIGLVIAEMTGAGKPKAEPKPVEPDDDDDNTGLFR